MLALRPRLPTRPVKRAEVGVPVVRIAAGDRQVRRSASGLVKVSRLLSVPVVTFHGLPGARLRDRADLEAPRHLVGDVADELMRAVVVGQALVGIEIAHVLRR